MNGLLTFIALLGSWWHWLHRARLRLVVVAVAMALFDPTVRTGDGGQQGTETRSDRPARETTGNRP